MPGNPVATSFNVYLGLAHSSAWPLRSLVQATFLFCLNNCLKKRASPPGVPAFNLAPLVYCPLSRQSNSFNTQVRSHLLFAKDPQQFLMFVKAKVIIVARETHSIFDLSITSRHTGILAAPQTYQLLPPLTFTPPVPSAELAI